MFMFLKNEKHPKQIGQNGKICESCMVGTRLMCYALFAYACDIRKKSPGPWSSGFSQMHGYSFGKQRAEMCSPCIYTQGFS